jgi:hypothetical protein
MLSRDDKDRDPYQDLIKLKAAYDETCTGKEGYIKDLGSHPSRVILFHDESFEVLDSLQKHCDNTDYDLCLVVDATGLSMQRLIKPLDTATHLIYSAVVRHPVTSEPPIALFEMITTDQSSYSTTLFYLRFFSRYVENLKRAIYN